ncbi:MAG: EAL domain-containing protein [Burkholderiales bacterium]|nr:EAL domain-containing protein [Burkholderiales bacterium]
MVLGLGLVVSILVWSQLNLHMAETVEFDFRRGVAEANHAIEKRMAAIEVALRAGAALATVKTNFTQRDWHQFVDALNIEKNHPGVQAIFWAPRLGADDLDRHAMQMRATGFSGYRVFPSGGNHEVTPVTFIEPLSERNLRALGFDMSSEAARREAMARARNTGQPSMTKSLELITEETKVSQPGVLMYMPVFAGAEGLPVAGVPELKGYVGGAFRLGDFMHAALSDLEPNIRIQMYDDQRPKAGALVFDNIPGLPDADRASQFQRIETMQLHGQKWRLAYSYFPEKNRHYRSEQRALAFELFGGLAISSLLFLVFLTQLALKERAAGLATAMTSALRESERRWQFALESGGDGLVDWNLATGQIFYSPRAAGMLGFMPEEMPRALTYEQWLDNMHPDDRAAGRAAFDHFQENPAIGFESEFRLKCKDGSYVWILARARAIESDSQGKPVRIIGVRANVTERRRRTEQLRLAAKVLESSSEGIMITDGGQRIVMVNAAFSRVTGYAIEEALGKTPHLLASGRHDAEFYQEMWTALRAGGFWQGEVWNRRKNGAVYPEWLTINHVLDEQGHVTHYVGIFTDISARKLSEARIEQLAHFDALTHLPNRILLQDRLEQAITSTRRAGNCMAVMFLDLDHFKTINDTLGHHWGDELLKLASQRLKAHVREGDTVARQGGDEFIIVLPNLHMPDDAAAVAAKLIEAMSAPYELNGKELTVTISVGISVLPQDADDMDSLTKHADAAMYHAKQSGRNNFQFYTEAMSRHSAQLLAMESALRYAVQRSQLVLHFQPQMRLRDNRLVGVEALVRWQHPERGLVPPCEFIPIAEDRGLIAEIGRWVLNEACMVNRRLQLEGGPAVPIAVNISAPQFILPDFLDQVEAALEVSGLEPQYLELELTESIVMRDVQSVISTLQTLKKLGVSLSIDDFGTGYCSLSYLKRLPIDKLKIDQSFVRDISVDADDAAITAAIINLARCLNLDVIAEGVESEQQLEFLRTLGCDEIQGYWLSKPLPAVEFSVFMRNFKL